MAERGGLEYTIEVRNQFSSALSAFRSEIAGAEAAFAQFRTTLQLARGSNRSLQNTTAAQARGAKLGAQAAEAQSRAARANARAQQAQATAAAAASRAMAAQANAATAAGRSQAQLTTALARASSAQANAATAATRTQIAQTRLATAANRLAISQNQVAASAARMAAAQSAAASAAARAQIAQANAAVAADIANNRLAISTANAAAAQNRAALAALRLRQAQTAAAQGARELGAAQERASRTGNSLFFTFRRLVGVLALFTVAREAASAIGTLIRETVTFSSSLEQAELGVAGLLTALGEVRGASGALLDGTQALNAAQAISRDQLAALRVEGLRTAATFEQLAQTFQTALAPGIQAGLNVDQIREFSVRISQAAAALAVPQNQLAEEIRSILSGTITARSTRIAVALGISNEDIRAAREAGRLAEFLQQRFSAFAVAGERALDTFEARFANARDAILQITQSGAVEFFDNLKLILQEVSEALFSISDTDQIVLNEGAIETARRFFQILDEGIDQVRSLGDEDFGGLVSALSEGGTLLVRLIGPALRGILRSLNEIGTAITPILQFANSVAARLSDVLPTVVAIGAELKIIAATVTAISFNSAVAGANTLRGILAGIASSAAAFFVAIVTPIVAALGVAQQFTKDSRGQVLSLIDTLKGLVLGLARAFTIIRDEAAKTIFFVSAVFNNLGSVFDAIVQDISANITASFSNLFDLLSDKLQNIPGTETLRRQLAAQAIVLRGVATGIKATSDAASVAARVLSETDKQFQKFSDNVTVTTEGIDAAVSKLFEGATFERGGLFSENVLDSLKQLITDIRNELGPEAAEAVQEALEKALPTFETLGTTAGNEFVEAFKKLIEGLPSLLESLAQIAFNTINRIANTTAGLVVDLLSGVRTNIRDVFNQLFRQIAQELIALAIRTAIVRGIQAASSLFAPGAPALGATGDAFILGGNKGGLVPAHSKARGYAHGGLPRPSNLHHTDTIPAWLAPGEFVVRAASVAKYGQGVLSALNEGRFNAGFMKSIAPASSPKPPSSGPGFQSGGAVSRPAPAGVSRAVVVADEQSFDRLLAGGQAALLRFMRENSGQVRASLGV